MTDLNTMMRDAARNGLKAQLETAVTNGDTEAANKVTEQLEALAVSTAPKAPPYGQADIRAELDKLPWFGTDPKKSALVVELGKTLDPKKFATAALFADALVKAVDAETKVKTGAGAAPPEDGDEDEGNEEGEDEGNEEGEGAKDGKTGKTARRSDAPGEGEGTTGRVRRSSGPWAKLSDAPPDVQKEIKRTADRFVSSNAPKEQRDKFIASALSSHYAQHQRTKAGKK